jgi:hypothetical protein
MTSIREQILSTIATRLASTAGVGGRVFRSRKEAVARGEMPAIIVQPIKDEAEAIGGICRTNRTLTVKIAILVHDDIPDQEADPIAVDLHPRLVAPGDVTLGGLAIDIQPMEDDFQFAATDGVVVMTYKVWYRHNVFDLASA